MTSDVTQTKQDQLQTVLNEIFHIVASVHDVETVLDDVIYDSIYDPELISQFNYDSSKCYKEQDNWIIFLFLSQLNKHDYDDIPQIDFIRCDSRQDLWRDVSTIILKFKENFYSFDYLWSSNSGYYFYTNTPICLHQRVPVERIVVDYVVKED